MKNESNWSKVNGKMLKSLKTIHNLLDLLITIYMLLIPVVLITGGFSLETPLFRISAHRIGSVLQILLPCVAAKWVLTRVLKTPFQINSRIVVIIKRAFEKGLLVLGCGENSIRFSPSLTVKPGEVDTCLSIFEDVLKEVAG